MYDLVSYMQAKVFLYRHPHTTRLTPVSTTILTKLSNNPAVAIFFTEINPVLYAIALGAVPIGAVKSNETAIPTNRIISIGSPSCNASGVINGIIKAALAVFCVNMVNNTENVPSPKKSNTGESVSATHIN